MNQLISDDYLNTVWSKESLDILFKESFAHLKDNNESVSLEETDLLRTTVAVAGRLIIGRHPDPVKHEEFKNIFSPIAKTPKQVSKVIEYLNDNLRRSYGCEITKVNGPPSQKPFLYFMIPISEWKVMNDRYGHTEEDSGQQQIDKFVRILMILFQIWFDNRQPTATLHWIRHQLARLKLAELASTEGYTDEKRNETLFGITLNNHYLSSQNNYLSPLLESCLYRLQQLQFISIKPPPKTHSSHIQRLNDLQITIEPGSRYSITSIKKLGLSLKQLEAPFQ